MKGGEVMLEVTPPSKRASRDAYEKALGRIASAVKITRAIDYINIPEILEENRNGIPLYKNADTREFGRRLSQMCGKRVILNKAVVFFPSKEGFGNWLDETVADFGITDIVLVGGSTGSRKYPGPSVVEANRLASLKAGVNIGNISIPQRENEAERMALKTQAGCKFFTTQIILEAGPVIRMLESYGRECVGRGLSPSPVFLSFAPASDADDIEFLKWLDVDVPSIVEARLLSSKSMGSESVSIAREVFSSIHGHSKKNAGVVPISLNVEQISQHNFEFAGDMLGALCAEMSG